MLAFACAIAYGLHVPGMPKSGQHPGPISMFAMLGGTHANTYALVVTVHGLLHVDGEGAAGLALGARADLRYCIIRGGAGGWAEQTSASGKPNKQTRANLQAKLKVICWGQECDFGLKSTCAHRV